MYFFLLLLSGFITVAASEVIQYSFDLIDQKGDQHTVPLNNAELIFFPTVQAAARRNQKTVSTWDYEDMSYETFVTILRPLCEALKTVGDSSTMIPVEQIRSKSLLDDTKRVIDWIYQKEKSEKEKENFTQSIARAYHAVDILGMPFAIRRGFVNYLYDQGIIIDQDDLANRSGLLISNYEINKGIEKTTSLLGSYDKKVNFKNAQIRFFDADHFCNWAINLEPYSASEGKEKPVYFDFSDNNIRIIDFAALNNCFNTNKKIRNSAFDFRKNPLSPETIAYILKNGSQYDYEHPLKSGSTLKGLTTSIQHKQIKLFWSSILAGIGSFGMFYIPYLHSLRSKLQNGTLSSLTWTNTLLGVGISAAAIMFGIKGMKSGWKNLNKKSTAQKTMLEEKEKLILIDKLFYIVYDK
jgi:hypothetical protein